MTGSTPKLKKKWFFKNNSLAMNEVREDINQNVFLAQF